MNAGIPIDASVLEINTCDEIGSVVRVFVRSQALPADAAFENCDVLYLIYFPISGDGADPFYSAVFHFCGHCAPPVRSAIL